MARCLNLTKAGEYAIAALSRLTLESRGEAVTVGELAREQEIPRSFLAKVIARCAKAGLVQARKGPDGGVALSRPADEISLLSIIEACEGDYRRDSCVFYAARRCEGPACEVYCPLRREEEGLRAGLAGVTLAQMAGSLSRHPYLKEETDGTSGRR